MGTLTRRTTALRRALLAALAALVLAAAPARALDPGAARSLVEGAIADIIALLASGAGPERAVPELRRIIETRSSVPALARYAAGPHWAGMDEGQRARFTDAFAASVSATYGRQFAGYDVRAEDLHRHVAVSGVTDAGAKGLYVRVAITPPGAPAVEMGFLVSDRPGRPVIVDMTVAGISLAITQREILQDMFASRGGDVERLIADLSAAADRQAAPELCRADDPFRC
ncbi:hypothetical protein LNKW23_42250 [Paralimibaculum aggregatum]|uniref:ABC transporter substrate-binding protein n=1 Tax=Paralimibaculum aggregatum TaxID=3036245 RepID=A0ABQ6LSG2_9RHOB|nr:ABC transporter substrate-binding protein [Limibaculum sp. NKW23]GMG85009.1 hypothetical protein LNKW23_42250 [Limibaculum sp. NKW23]